MCGIAGYIGKGDRATLEKMAYALRFRGPDDESFYENENVGFAFRRLSIIDLAGGRQPISNEDKTIWAICNGEIYNYKNLRADLEKMGHRFNTGSDVEVIVHGYEEMGDSVFSRLDGMFSVALYDQKNKKFLLARDRFGKKPLYYGVFGGTLVFGSELKALLQHPAIPRELDMDALALYMTYEFVPTPHSIFRSIKKLEPGHYITYYSAEPSRFSIERFWSTAGLEEEKLSEQEAVQKLDGLFEKAVSKRLMSDVPLGVFLSGGVDSSTIAYYAQKVSPEPIHTFTVGFKEKSFDESDYARRVAKFLGTKHFETEFSVKDALGFFDTARELMDEPLADAQVLPSLLLSKFTKEYATVVLGGDGGDEVFLGYQHFPAQVVNQWFQHVPRSVRSGIEKVSQFIPVGSGYFSPGFKLQRFLRGQSLDLNMFEHDLVWRSSFAPSQYDALFAPEILKIIHSDFAFSELGRRVVEVDGKDNFDTLSRLYLKQYLMDDCMTMIDRTSMRFGLEVRAPFQDRELVEFVLSLPTHFRLKFFKGKYILKKLMENKLPREIVHRKKKGFGIPVAEWLRGELRQVADDYFSNSFLQHQGIFNPEYVEKLYAQHLSGKKDFRKELWTLLMFQLWYDTWLNK